jgi:hypothetical protein
MLDHVGYSEQVCAGAFTSCTCVHTSNLSKQFTAQNRCIAELESCESAHMLLVETQQVV